MHEETSLAKIIDTVLQECGILHDESNKRMLHRSFEKLLEKIGTDKEFFKSGRKTFSFNKTDTKFMKIIIRQLYYGKGIIAQFVDNNLEVSSVKVRDLIQSILDEEDKDGADEEELKHLACFLDKLFNCGALYSIENCHDLIDAIALNLDDLTSTDKIRYLSSLEQVLRSEFVSRITESIINMTAIAELVELSKEACADDIGIQNYTAFDPEIRFEYIQRDKSVLARIQEDDDLRYYIEKKIGKKVESIFNYEAT